MINKWHKFPFDPKSFPFFYGWIIVAASTLGIYASIPGQTMGVGVFIDYLIDVLKLTRTEISTAYMIGTIGSSLILPFAGRLLDQIGSRKMIVFSSLGLAISLILLSRSDRLIQLINKETFLVTMIILSVGFLLLRFFGQGCLGMVSRVNIGKWFDHRRGLATAIMGVFGSFGFNSSPIMLNYLIENLGWRLAYLFLAILIGIGMSLLGWIFYRDTPEQCGLVMDGFAEKNRHKKMAAKIPYMEKDFTKGEAIRTLAFWAFSIGLAIVGLIITAVTFHIASLGNEFGLSRSQAYSVFLPIAFFSVGANFFSSWISDKIRLKWLLIAMMAAQFVSLAGLLDFNHLMGRAIFIAGQGCAGGLFVSLSIVVMPRYFGRKHLGAISGFIASVMVLGTALGPILFSTVHNITGNYKAVIWGCLILPLSIMLIGIKADNPQLQNKKED